MRTLVVVVSRFRYRSLSVGYTRGREQICSLPLVYPTDRLRYLNLDTTTTSVRISLSSGGAKAWSVPSALPRASRGIAVTALTAVHQLFD